MKIGLLKETKTPVDNRVALIPAQIKELSEKYPDIEFKVQSSDIRAYSDDEYLKEGIEVSDNVDDCDLLLGIKEADISTIIPGKHYIFFGHIAKKQAYNKPLFKKLLDLNTTFSDYEYLVGDDGIRLVAFGWYAGVVGVYYTLMGWGLRTKTFELTRPHMHFSIEEIIHNIKEANISGVKIVLTGSGRVSHGAQHILKEIGALELSPEEFLNIDQPEGIAYCVLPIDELVAPDDPNKEFELNDFINNPKEYHATFSRYTRSADIMLSCHFWTNNQPVYLDREDSKRSDFRIKMIGDITCDIKGSIKSTLRPSTHSAPFYDYNPFTDSEEPAFSTDRNITVMAVDTCPNALPRVTSQYFGEQLTKHVLIDLLNAESDRSKILDRATIIRDGRLTAEFEYLNDYVASF